MLSTVIVPLKRGDGSSPAQNEPITCCTFKSGGTGYYIWSGKEHINITYIVAKICIVAGSKERDWRSLKATDHAKLRPVDLCQQFYYCDNCSVWDFSTLRLIQQILHMFHFIYCRYVLKNTDRWVTFISSAFLFFQLLYQQYKLIQQPIRTWEHFPNNSISAVSSLCVQFMDDTVSNSKC